MSTLSASEAITPVFQRTEPVLFQPFRIGCFWKLAATAHLALMGSLFVPAPLATLLPHAHGTRPGAALFHILPPLFAGALMFLFFYVGAGLQFARFDIVLRGEYERPFWRRYAPFTGRRPGLKLALSALFLLVLGASLAFVLPRILAHLQVTPGQWPPPGLFLHLFLLEAILCLSIFFLIFCCSSLFDDCILPSVTLEGVSLREAFRRFAALLRNEPGAFLYHVVFKFVFALGCAIAMEIGTLVTEWILAIPLVLLGLVGWPPLHTLGPTGHLLIATGLGVLLLTIAAILFYATVGFIGEVLLFLQFYALYFLAGRYPLLGGLLDPPAPDFADPTPPPPAPASQQLPFFQADTAPPTT
jgi:hypothetical protein